MGLESHPGVAGSANENNVNGWRAVVVVPNRGVLGMSGHCIIALPPTTATRTTQHNGNCVVSGRQWSVWE